MLVMNTAGYTHAFVYKGRTIMIPCDGRVHVVPDDIPKFLELKVVGGVAPQPVQKPVIAASAVIKRSIEPASYVEPTQYTDDEEIISIELDEELKDVKIYDIFNEKYVKAKNLNSGYDDELNTILASHLARNKVDQESEELSGGIGDNSEHAEAAATFSVRKKTSTLAERTEKRRAERERIAQANRDKVKERAKNKAKAKKAHGRPKTKEPVDPNAPKRKAGRPPKIAPIETEINIDIVQPENKE